MTDDLDRDTPQEQRPAARIEAAWWETRKTTIEGALFCAMVVLAVVCYLLGSDLLGGLLVLSVVLLILRRVMAEGTEFYR